MSKQVVDMNTKLLQLVSCPCFLAFRWTYADPSWARIAALVPVVVSCAEAGDEIANKILNGAVKELASTVKAVVQRLGLAGKGLTSIKYEIILRKPYEWKYIGLCRLQTMAVASSKFLFMI